MTRTSSKRLSALIHACAALLLISLSAPAQWTPTPNDTLAVPVNQDQVV